MLMKVAEFERLFRQAAGLDVDKNDLKRVSDFLRDKLYDLLAVAERNAKYNGRDLIFEPDLPIAKGLQETLQEFRRMDTALELKPVLDALAALPPLDLEVAEDEEPLPRRDVPPDHLRQRLRRGPQRHSRARPEALEEGVRVRLGYRR